MRGSTVRNARITVDLKYPHQEGPDSALGSPQPAKPLVLLPPSSSGHRSPRSESQGSVSLHLRSTSFYVLVLVLITILLSCVNFLYAAGKFGNVSALQSRIESIFHYLRASIEQYIIAYRNLLNVYPLNTRAITTGIIFFVADVIAQHFRPLSTFRNGQQQNSLYLSQEDAQLEQGERRRLAWVHSLCHGGFGLVVIGPLLYGWYELMYRMAPADMLHWAIAKAGFESLTLQPLTIVLSTAYESFVFGRLEGQVLRLKFLPMWGANVIFWNPANFANYFFGSRQMRVCFSNTCSVLWHVYLSERITKVLVARGFV